MVTTGRRIALASLAAALLLSVLTATSAAGSGQRTTTGRQPAMNVTAVDEAASAGLAQTTETGQSTVADLNGDGLPDIFLNRAGLATAQEFLNNGDGTFTEANAGTFVDADRRDCASADVNGDGRADIFCSLGAHHASWLKSDELWMQQTDGTFINQDQQAGVAAPMARSRRTVFLDANGDGHPDLFVSADPDRPDGLPSSDQLFINQGDGTFADSPSYGLDVDYGSSCLVSADINGDGLPDILSCGGYNDRPMQVLYNDDNSHFTDVTADVGLAGLDPASAILVDLNQDGALDVVMVVSHTLLVMLQQGGVFQPSVYTLPLGTGGSAAAGDVNGDGLPDLYVATAASGSGNAPDVMLLNQWDGSQLTFQQMTIPETTQGAGDSVYPLDYDGNGLTDFLVLNGNLRKGPIQLIAFFPESHMDGPVGRSRAHAASPRAAPVVGSAANTGSPAGLDVAAAQTCSPTWGALSTPTVQKGEIDLRSIASVGDGTAWAVGAQGTDAPPAAEFWNGTSFSLVTTPDLGVGDDGLNGVATHGGSDVWAVGFKMPTTTYVSVAEHWDGTAWTVSTLPDVGTGTNILLGVAADGTGGAWSVGEKTVGDIYQTLVERWNGTAWSVASTPNAPNSGSNALESVVALDATHAWAVGYARDLISGAYRTLTLRTTDGSTWESVPSPNPSADHNVLLRVAASSPDDVWAVGYQTTGSTYVPLAEHWDGSAWTATSIPAPPGWFAILRGVTMVGPANVWAVGAWYDSTSDTYEPLVEHWDGQAWSVVPSPKPQGDSQLIGVANGPTGQLWAVGRNQSNPRSALAQQLCPVQALVSGWLPATVSLSQGNAVAWSFPVTDGSSHSVTDSSGMGLFDSGVRAPGGSFVYTFQAASSYRIVDTVTGLTSLVKIATLASPKTGGVGDTYTVTWSTAAAPAGYVFDVAMKRPGQTGWVVWMTTTSPSATFVPDSGAGKYQFHTRLRNLANGRKALYSPPASITAS